MVSFSDAIRSLCPNANSSLGGNCSLAWEPDRGHYIAAWNESILGPQPTAEQIAAAMAQPEPIMDPIPARIAAAWQAAHDLAFAALDLDARTRCLAWLIDPNASAAKKSAILACQAWADSVWQHYYVVKAQIEAGQDVRFTFGTPCPHTFREIIDL